MPQDDSRGTRTDYLPGSIATIRLFGVPLRLHFTFVLLVIFLLVVGATDRQGAMKSVLNLLALFGSVILHELGHALTARRYGIRTLEIVMFPIGGVARLERLPKPREELVIASAGPVVNLVLAALIYAGIGIGSRTVADYPMLEAIAQGNLLLAAFNLLPAFPMDGGRILRAVLALRRPHEDATRVAARAGRVLAVGMAMYGLLNSNYIVVFISFFVYLGALQESAAATGRMLMRGIPVRAAMITQYETLSHGHTIRDAAERLLATSQQDFPVVHGVQVIGLLGRNRLLKAMATDGPEAYVAGAMDRQFTRLDPEMDLSEALPLLTRRGPCALVMEGDQLLGLLTTENISEFLLLRRFGLQPPERQTA
jgi:stage IV sporulation protein FB